MSPSVQLDPPPAAERERARLHEREGRRPAARAGDVSLRQWHQTEPEETLRALGASREGLTAAEAEDRLAAHGPNIIAEARRRGPLRILLAQLADFMILVLLAAAFVSGLIGEFEDALAIVAVVVMNALIGFVQEYRADRAVAALRAMAAPSARVVRSRAVATIPAAEVVPGDLVLLEAGGVVPTDLRLLEAARLKVDESALTGESVPVEKTLAPLPEADLTVGDRTNMAYKGTLVTYGRGAGVAVATGGLTELGRIASLLSEAPEVKTPLQRRLAQLGRRVAVAALAICGVVFAAGLLRGEPPMLMFLTAVSLAVAAIPEALPAVVTIALALGARKMARQKALVRKLPAVETLGSVTYVCADKTGTLTLNRMRVEELYCAGRRAAVARGERP